MLANNPIDNLLNRITMYRLVLYVLSTLILAGFAASFFGVMPFQAQNLVFSAIVLTLACLGFNWLFAKFFRAQAGSESSYITAFILILIITPPAFTADGFAFLIFASLFAIASKYVLAWDKKHAFNPAAFGVAATALAFGWYASWWVGGNWYLLPIVLIGGLLVVHKLQRFDMVAAFILAALLSILIGAHVADPLATIEKLLIHTTLFFFAFIMLTEPATTPPGRWLRVIYGALVGLLFSPAVHFGAIYSTPEFALLIGNVFSFIVSPKLKAVLTLKEKRHVGGNLWEFIFERPRHFAFSAGQYLEWTLAHKKLDTRGNRRYFTISSAPTERHVHIGVRMEERGSSFKKKLLAMEPGHTIAAGQLAGDFVLPKNPKEKLAFLAGGIGVTPMRSMLKHLADKGEKRDVVMLYSARTRADVAYMDVFDEAAQKTGAKILYCISDERPGDGARLAENVRLGVIDAEMLRKEIPDFAERTFYISGPRGMVVAFQKALRAMGVPCRKIKIDFFPGFA